MLDCDCERKKDRNWYIDTTRDHLADDIPGLYRCNTINIWDYITKVNRESARFFNFLHAPCKNSHVLRPSYKMCSLDIWDFYLSETLETGCPYDLDIALAEHGEHLNDAELRQRNKCISAVYDDISLCLPDFFNEIVTVRIACFGDGCRTMPCHISRISPIRCNRRTANRGRSTGIKSRHLNERKHRYGVCMRAGSHLSMFRFQRLSIQDEAYKRVNSQPNYLQQPQRSLSSSISSSRTSSIYGSHTYESTQFSTPQICDTCDELIDTKKSPHGLTRSPCSSPFRAPCILPEGIRALQCRDCANVCHEKCRSAASCKPCRRVGVTGTSDSQIVVNSSRFETGSVTGTARAPVATLGILLTCIICRHYRRSFGESG